MNGKQILKYLLFIIAFIVPLRITFSSEQPGLLELAGLVVGLALIGIASVIDTKKV